MNQPEVVVVVALNVLMGMSAAFVPWSLAVDHPTLLSFD